MRFVTILLHSAAAFLATPNEFIATKDSHCDSALIEIACEALSHGRSSTHVTREQLISFLGEDVDSDELSEWLARFGVEDASSDIACKTLCHTAVHMYAAQLPWTPDTGCKHVPSTEDASKAVTVCDIDLDPEQLKQLQFADQKEHKDTVQEEAEHSGKRAEEKLEVIFARMDKALLRNFRSYPLLDVAADFSEEGALAVEKEGVEVPRAMMKQTETPLEAKVETHVSAMLQVKQQPASSFLQLHSASSAYAVACVHDADFRANSGLCPSFLDEQQVFAQIQQKHPKLAAASFAQSHDGCPSTCALSGHIAAGCESCASFVQISTHRVAKVQAKTGQEQWQHDVVKVSAKAQAYLNIVLQGMNKMEFDAEMRKWYNTNEEKFRMQVTAIIKSVLNMIDNVDYVYPGPQCSPNTYAYVYPKADDIPGYTFSEDGRFRFFLCPYYMQVALGEQVETLTHEGSHHRSAYTDDVMLPGHGQKAYGRPACELLAKLDNSLALRNADSVSYFIQDAAISQTHEYLGPSRAPASSRFLAWIGSWLWPSR